jgi:hypothetical protein
MLAGCPPFQGDEEDALFNDITNNPLREHGSIKGDAWDIIMAVCGNQTLNNPALTFFF